MRALLIPVDGDPQPVDFRDGEPDVWADMIGAKGIDFITVREKGVQVLVDDRSITNNHPMNLRVTWFLKGSGRWLSEVYGTVLIVGLHHDTGETIDMHEVLYAALLATS